MKELEIQRLIGEGFNCSQIVAGSFSTDFGMDVSLARKVGACFGGGMDCGETCGAVTGALMVLGLKYGNESPNTPQAAAKAREKSAEFRELFLKKYDSTICRELLGYNIADPDELKILLENNFFITFCVEVVADAIAALEETLESRKE